MCSMWLRAVFGVITSSAAICLLDRPRATSRRTSTSRVVSPAGQLPRRPTECPAAARTAATASAIELPRPHVGLELLRGVLSAERWTVRTRLAHRPVRVDGSEDSCLSRDRRARETLRVARAVESLTVLDGDLRERRERRRLMEHPLGQIGVQSDPLPLADAQRARLVPDRVRHAESPEIVHEPGSAQHLRFVLSQPELCRRRGRELCDRAGVAERVRRLEIDEVRDREQRLVESSVGERDAQGGLGVDHRVPRLAGIEVAEDPFRIGAQDRRQLRIELQTGAPLGQLDRCTDAAQPVRHLDELRELRQPSGDRDAIPGEAARPALAVPGFVRGADRLLHGFGKAEPLGQRTRDHRVALDHPVEVATARGGELEPHAEAVQRRVAASDERHRGGGRAQAPKVAVVLARLQRDVVAEPLRLLVRVGMAADVDEQPGVVDGRAFGVAEPDAVGQPERNQAFAQDVFHRLPEAEIDAERERRDELRETHFGHGTTMDHAAQPDLL